MVSVGKPEDTAVDPGCLILLSKQFADRLESLLTALGHGDVNRAEVLITLFGGNM